MLRGGHRNITSSKITVRSVINSTIRNGYTCCAAEIITQKWPKRNRLNAISSFKSDENALIVVLRIFNAVKAKQVHKGETFGPKSIKKPKP